MRTYALRKSYVTNERTLALDEFLQNRNNSYDSSPGVYVRSDRDRELDILWQGTRVHAREERSPVFYLSTGFIAGIVSVFLISAFLNFGNPSSSATNYVASDAPRAATVNVPGDGPDEVQDKPAPKVKEKSKEKTKNSGSLFSWWKPKDGKNVVVAVSPSFKDEYVNVQTYTVKSGDTLEGIAYRFYGMGGPIRVARIQDANNMKSPDHLQIGQQLIIPVEN
ncbi:MAG: LysM peptidoglycan-binding domain-containing protein [Candidatus Gastranaerophilales bacterium]|nr:LysM peptidoglycan-binding domain-containing protein [Candidatus Gastranaerophilales bacterium]